MSPKTHLLKKNRQFQAFFPALGENGEMRKKIGFVSLAILVFGSLAHGGDLDSASQEALEKTKALLGDPNLRKDAVTESKEARQADDQVRKLGLSPTDQEAVYRLSGSIFESMVKDSGGDAAAMKEKVNGFMRDPASMEKTLKPADREEIRRLGTSIDLKNTPPR